MDDEKSIKVLEEIRDAIRENGEFAKQAMQKQKEVMKKLSKLIFFALVASIVLLVVIQTVK